MVPPIVFPSAQIKIHKVRSLIPYTNSELYSFFNWRKNQNITVSSIPEKDKTFSPMSQVRGDVAQSPAGLLGVGNALLFRRRRPGGAVVRRAYPGCLRGRREGADRQPALVPHLLHSPRPGLPCERFLVFVSVKYFNLSDWTIKNNKKLLYLKSGMV